MTIISLSFAAIWLTFIVGWVWNIVRLIGYFPLNFQAEGAEFILRIVGIFVAPLGAVLGFIPF